MPSHARVRARACVLVHAFAWVRVLYLDARLALRPAREHAHTNASVHARAHTDAHASVHTPTRKQKRARAHMHTRARTHTHTHTRTHAQMISVIHLRRRSILPAVHLHRPYMGIY